MMTENLLIDEFLNYLKFERHFSPHTAKCYAADLAQFCAFLVGDRGAAKGGQAFGTAEQSAESHAAAAGTPSSAFTAVLSETDVRQRLQEEWCPVEENLGRVAVEERNSRKDVAGSGTGVDGSFVDGQGAIGGS